MMEFFIIIHYKSFLKCKSISQNGSKFTSNCLTNLGSGWKDATISSSTRVTEAGKMSTATFMIIMESQSTKIVKKTI